MSEPVTHAEIEDVLSSIRRLVSENKRAVQSGGAKKVVNGASAKPHSRLVLTPALRVAENQNTSGQTGIEQALDPGARTAAGREDRLVTQNVDLDHASDSVETSCGTDMGSESSPEAPHIHVDEIAEQTGDVAPFTQIDNEVRQVEEREDETAAGSLVEQDAISDEANIQPDNGENSAETSQTCVLSAGIEDPTPGAPLFFDESEDSVDVHSHDELVAETDLSLSDAQPHTSELETEHDVVSHGAGEPPESAPWREPGATLYAAARADEVGQNKQIDDEPELAPHSARAAAVLRRIAELETAQKAGADLQGAEILPDQGSADEAAKMVPATGLELETLAWEDHVEEDAAPSPPVSEATIDTETNEAHSTADSAVLPDEDLEPTQPTETETVEPEQPSVSAFSTQRVAQVAVEEAALDQLAEQDDILDEEALRELVADIVRKELQGALGERITRNVRKLVRREIQRALASQELF